MNDRRHIAKEHSDELLTSHRFHRLLAVSAEKLIRRFDKLWVSVEKLKPAVLAVAMTGLVNHVKLVSAVLEERMLDREVPRTHLSEELRRQFWELPILVGAEFGRKLRVVGRWSVRNFFLSGGFGAR